MYRFSLYSPEPILKSNSKFLSSFKGLLSINSFGRYDIQKQKEMNDRNGTAGRVLGSSIAFYQKNALWHCLNSLGIPDFWERLKSNTIIYVKYTINSSSTTVPIN